MLTNKRPGCKTLTNQRPGYLKLHAASVGLTINAVDNLSVLEIGIYCGINTHTATSQAVDISVLVCLVSSQPKKIEFISS